MDSIHSFANGRQTSRWNSIRREWIPVEEGWQPSESGGGNSVWYLHVRLFRICHPFHTIIILRTFLVNERKSKCYRTKYGRRSLRK
jgi:hypothetical protein